MPRESGSTTTAERILAAAESLFASAGFDGVSVNAVAQQAGVSKANVFHHFGSKEELYVAVLQNARRQLTEELFALSSDKNAPLDATFAQFADRYLQALFEREDLTRLFLRESLQRQPIGHETLAERVFGPTFAPLVEFLRAAQHSGQLRDEVDPALPLLLLVGGCLFFFQNRDILRHLPEVGFADDNKRYARDMADILLNGIKKR